MHEWRLRQKPDSRDSALPATHKNGYAMKRRKLTPNGTHDSHNKALAGESEHKTVARHHEMQDVSEPELSTTKSVQQSRVPKTIRNGTTIMATGGLTKSSLMQLQVNDLVEELRPDHEYHLRDLKDFTDKLIQTIKSIPSGNPTLFREAQDVLRKQYDIAIPLGNANPPSDVKYKFEYKPPERVSLRGELVQHLCTRQDLRLEVAVNMPSELFQEKDYLDFRAIFKRAHYLACIAAGLQKSLKEECGFRYEFLNGDKLVPAILVKPKTSINLKASKDVKIMVNIVFPSNIAPSEKLLPNQNCIRRSWEINNRGEAQTSPTPGYNSTLCSLKSTTSMDQLLEDATNKCDAFADACLLGRNWLRQRGLSSNVLAGGFGILEWAYMCALLLHGGGHKGHPLFSNRYSSLQLFKAMLQVLANRDLTQPLLVRASNLHFETNGLPMLYDGHTGVNVFAKTGLWFYDLLRHMAQLSLTAVNGQGQDSFVPTFITKVAEPNLEFDEVYQLRLSGDKLPDGATERLYRILKQGLGDRISLLVLQETAVQSWTLSSPHPDQSDNSQLIEVQLLVNAETQSRLIDHGPSVEEQEEAKKFRQFWGEKSELRRFRDGSITETLVWSAEKPVTLQILEHLAATQFKPSKALVSAVPDVQTRLITHAPISAEDAFKIVNNKYQELSSKLHQMEGLPLPIRSVSLVSEALRSASLDHPLDPDTAKPIDIIIQFDSSARWPDHLLAIQHTKIAFLAKISDLVSESDASVTTRIGVENTNTSATGYRNTSFLDIMFPSPALRLSPIVFRLRIHHEREIQLLQERLANQDITPPIRDTISSALLEHKRSFIASTNHTGSLRNLITHFQPLSATIRLLKAWFASHNLSNHILNPALEIIAAHIFLHPYPWSIPGSPRTAFLRCLYFLSQWDWQSSPLIVDLSLSQDMTSAQLTELETRYQAWRKLDPHMNTVAWFVGTSVDNTGTIWTQGAKPARVVAGRVTALAKAAIEVVKERGTDMADHDWDSLFVSPTEHFDIVIRLKSSVVRGVKGSKATKDAAQGFKNLQIQQDLDVDSIGYDPVSLYLEDLERAFANVVLFFHGEGGKYIAGLWRPNVTGAKEWRVRLGFSTIPSAGLDKDKGSQTDVVATINKEAILNEMALLGEGLIEKISVKE